MVASKASFTIDANRLSKEVVKLKSTWTYYPQEFVDTENKNRGYLVSRLGERLENSQPRTHGSYRVKIKINEIGEPRLGIMMGPYNPSTTLYQTCNGKLTKVFSNGMTGSDPKTSIFTMAPAIGFFPYCQEFELIVHTSNYHYHPGNFIAPLYLGSERFIRERESAHFNTVYFCIGLFMTAMIFNLSLFLQRPEDRGSLYLTLFTLTQAIRYCSTEHLIYRFYPEFSTDKELLNQQFVTMTTALTALFLTKYIQTTFPRLISDKLQSQFTGISAFFFFVPLIPLTNAYYELFSGLVGVAVTGIVGTVLFLFSRYPTQTDSSLRVSFLGLAALVFSLMFDFISIVLGWDIFVSHIGAGLCIILQSQVVGIRFATNFRLTTQLKGNLEKAHQQLVEFVANALALQQNFLN